MDNRPAQSDAALVEASLSGDQHAFAALIKRHAQPLAALIRYRIADAAHAEDVLQETLLAAWRDLAGLRDAARLRAWLFGVARNQCRLHHRSRERRDVPTPDDEIAGLVNRFGPADAGRRAARSEALRTVAAARPADRDVLQAFYIDGFTIREIAARRDVPVGTVKRRLHTARRNLRETMGLAPAIRRTSMAANDQSQDRAPFPAKRPAIDIRPLAEQPPPLDCRELRWWYVVPELGDAVSFAVYDAPDWTLTGVTTLRAAAEANVHGVAGVRIDVEEHGDGDAPGDGIQTMYGALGEQNAEWLAVVERHGGRERMQTFLDDGWEQDWGPVPRRLETGMFRERAPGAFETDGGDQRCGVAGLFELAIGDRKLRCARILDVDLLGGPAADEVGVLIEAFVTLAGRTVLCRRYNARRWRPRDGPPWDQRLPNSARLVIDDAVYVHWYDHVVSGTSS